MSKKKTGGQIFGIIWGCLGVWGIISVMIGNPNISETMLGYGAIINSIIFIIPGTLLFYICKK